MPGLYSQEDVVDKLQTVLEALKRIPMRFATVNVPDDFLDSESGREHLDSICMVLLAAGECFKQLDNKTHGTFRTEFPHLPWSEMIGMRNVIAHGYFDIDHEQVFSICQNNIPNLIADLESVLHRIETS